MGAGDTTSVAGVSRPTRHERQLRRAESPRYRWQVLTVLMVGVFSSSFPTTLLSASLPVIAKDLHTTTSVISWVQTAPAIAFAIGMPFFGKLGDLHGHRRAFIYGFAGTAISALLTASAFSAGALIVIRTLGQLCGAATSTAAFGLIATVFEREERAKAVGVYTSVLAMSPVIAVVAGGPLIDAIGWRPLFVIQALPAILAVLVAIPVLPDTPRKPATRFDLAGAATLGVAVTAALFAVNRGGVWGWASPAVVAGFVLAPIALAAFVTIERRLDDPLLPLDFFARRDFTASIGTNALVQMAYLGGFTIAPFMISRLFGYKTYKTALILIIRPILFSIGAALAGRSERRFGGRFMQVSGSCFLTAGALVTGLGAWNTSLPEILLGLALTGWGVGIARPSNTTAVTNSVDEIDVGVATGVLNMIGQIGAAVGITVLLAIVAESREPSTFAVAGVVSGAIAAASIMTAALLRRAPAE
jgi:MFS family permease